MDFLNSVVNEFFFLFKLRLESESGLFCNIRYIEELVTRGDWEELEKYMSGFIHIDDNRFSVKMLFEIRKQKYLEALDK